MRMIAGPSQSRCQQDSEGNPRKRSRTSYEQQETPIARKRGPEKRRGEDLEAGTREVYRGRIPRNPGEPDIDIELIFSKHTESSFAKKVGPKA